MNQIQNVFGSLEIRILKLFVICYLGLGIYLSNKLGRLIGTFKNIVDTKIAFMFELNRCSICVPFQTDILSFLAGYILHKSVRTLVAPIAGSQVS